jgi:3-oxoacyl-[acyl-carrier protein] reductase
MLLHDKVVLITGGTAGIGEAIAHEFAKAGAHIVIFGTHLERGNKVIEELEKIKVDPAQSFLLEIVDISKGQPVEEAIERLLKKFGRCDILVNNAGITRDNLLMKMDEKDWDLVLETNLKSVFNTCRVLIRPMLKAKRGKIINITSVVGLTGNAGQVNYAASKSGMIGFTKSLAQEVASRNICVNCIAPGFIMTRMTEGLNEPQKEAIFKKIPMGRMGSGQDIAKAALFLASDHSSYITGQVLTVDGGMVM